MIIEESKTLAVTAEDGEDLYHFWNALGKIEGGAIVSGTLTLTYPAQERRQVNGAATA